MYRDEEFLQLSGIQHFAFCRRQWALIHIEAQWQENIRTVEGKIMHKRVHDAFLSEKRGDIIISHALPVHSYEIGISGECDIVEFHKSKQGIPLFGLEGLYQVIPIEYKKGAPKISDFDILQLTAQALCLEEMLCCKIEYGFLYYGETRHRSKIVFDEEIIQKTKELVLEMHQYYEKRYTPKVRWSKSCNACSLNDICVPVLGKKKSVEDYLKKSMED